MPTNENPLSVIRTKKEIVELSNDTEKHYRKSTVELYDEVLHLTPQKKFTEDGLILIYKTLKAFNMDSKGAKLSELSDFKKSLKNHSDTIQSLTKYRLEKVKETDDNLKDTIGSLFDNLKLVKTNSRLVTFSKTMHFLLPHLFMPIDRKYTLKFFHKTYMANKDMETQKRCFFGVFEYFRQFAHEHKEYLEKQVDDNSRWNRNIPKIIDNIIIGYMSNPENMG